MWNLSVFTAKGYQRVISDDPTAKERETAFNLTSGLSDAT